MPSPDIAAGQLIIYRGSRLEALLQPLRAMIQAAPPEHVLAPVQIVAGHAGMRPWLGASLARAAGPGGISANLDIQLPSSWLERLTQQALGESAVALAPYAREQLRWRIHGLLADAPSPRVQAYLHGSDGPRRRMQLAEHLAGLFSRYIIYRRDWLAAWARGEQVLPSSHEADSPLPWLWQRLRVQIGQAHRGERLGQLVEALTDGAHARGDALHLFGLNHLAPSELAVFAALARHRPVVLYLPDPCRLDWFELAGQRQRLRRALASGVDADTAFLEQDHPLLASWGRLGQEFLLGLEDMHASIDVRHWQDDADVAPRDRLSRLQEGIRRLQPDLLRPVGDEDTHGGDLRGDASLRVHACHTRLRELEVLRDALLRALAEIDGLTPGQIVVMAPDIHAYLPLLPAVFGAPGEAGGPLPYHLADVAIAHAHPLLQAFLRLLDLPGSRLPVAEVIDLLRVPQIAARVGLQADGAERIGGWLQQARVAWALDGGQRARSGLPAIDAHSFAWGMDRLLATHVFGDTGGEPITLPDGTLLAPLAGVEGPQATDLGALDVLLVQLAAWQVDAGQPRRASDWAQRLERRLDGLFRAELEDRAAQDALVLLRRQIRALHDQPAQAGLDPELDYAAVRDVLQQGLQATPGRQPFLLGGVTMCGMVPQRAIPFAVVAVLGLNEGEFPRTGIDGGLDLMAGHPRAGDRDLRFDDRYLFLETLMSARRRLHLSYVGEGAGDGKRRNPAAPLAELLAELDRAHQVPADLPADPSDAQAAARRPWLVRHPLQPFDARYFDGRDPALYSHRGTFAAMTGTGEIEMPAFATLSAPSLEDAVGAPPDQVLELRQVLAYYKDPARQLLRDGLKLRLDHADAGHDSEPLDAAPSRRDQLPQRLFRDAIRLSQSRLPERMPAWLEQSGLLASGVMGQRAWAGLREQIDPLLGQASGLALFANGWPRPLPVAGTERRIGERRLAVAYPDAWLHAGAPWVLALLPAKKLKDIDLGQRIRLFLQWALLRLDPAYADGALPLSLLAADGLVEDAYATWNLCWSDADAAARGEMHQHLQARVERLLALYLQAQRAPLAYFPKSSTAAGLGRSIDAAWAGGYHQTGERDYAPGYAQVLAGQAPFDDPAQRGALIEIAQELERFLDLGEAAS